MSICAAVSNDVFYTSLDEGTTPAWATWEITRHPPKQWNSIWLGSTPVRMSVSGDNLIVLCENGALWRIIQRNHGRLTKHRQAWTVQIARALYHGVKE